MALKARNVSRLALTFSFELYLRPMMKSDGILGPMDFDNSQGDLAVREPKSRQILRRRLYGSEAEETPVSKLHVDRISWSVRRMRMR